ncbi:MAG TPA: hypothetical protein VJ546_06015 [Bacillales bacterium]|nr:hypothetical protein [Bacillales bacterium]
MEKKRLLPLKMSKKYVYNEEVKGRTAVMIANDQTLKGIISLVFYRNKRSRN